MSDNAKTQNNHSIQAVIFDLDGVLMDSEWIGFQSWQELVETHGGSLEERYISEMVGMSAEETAVYVMDKTGLVFDVDQSAAWVWQRMIERLKLEITPLPGAVALIHWLAARGVAMAVASNSYTGYIENALAGLKLSSFLPVRVGIDQVAQGKPAPDVYLAAAQRLGVDPACCVAIEDSPVGMQAASAAGMRVIAVPDARMERENHGFRDAWMVRPSLVEVFDHLQQIL